MNKRYQRAHSKVQRGEGEIKTLFFISPQVIGHLQYYVTLIAGLPPSNSDTSIVAPRSFRHERRSSSSPGRCIGNSTNPTQNPDLNRFANVTPRSAERLDSICCCYCGGENVWLYVLEWLLFLAFYSASRFRPIVSLSSWKAHILAYIL